MLYKVLCGSRNNCVKSDKCGSEDNKFENEKNVEMWIWADHTTVDGSSSLFVVFDLTERWFIHLVWRILEDFENTFSVEQPAGFLKHYWLLVFQINWSVKSVNVIVIRERHKLGAKCKHAKRCKTSSLPTGLFPHFCMMCAHIATDFHWWNWFSRKECQCWQMLLHYLSHNEFSLPHPPFLCLSTLSSYPLLLHDTVNCMTIRDEWLLTAVSFLMVACESM